MIKPLGNKILITPDQSDSTLFGDMEMPDSAVEKPVTGVVLSVGPKVDQSFVKEGDKVAYSPHAVVTIEVWGEKVSYVREDDIVLVMSDGKERAGESNFHWGDVVRIVNNIPDTVDLIGTVGILEKMSKEGFGIVRPILGLSEMGAVMCVAVDWDDHEWFADKYLELVNP